MAGMKRFVTYIYAYEEKKKGSNVGFAKIEIRGEECRIEVHLRGAYVKTARCDAYLFRAVDGSMEGVCIGEVRLLNGKGDFAVSVRANHIGESTLGIYDMEGILLLGDGGQFYMSRWKEGEAFAAAKENFRSWMPQAEKVGEVVLEEPMPQAKMPQTLMAEKNVSQEKNAQEPSASVASSKKMSDKSLQATELPMHNVFPVCDWEMVWESFKQNHTLCHPFADREVECVQIELKHLRELPQRYWYLGNNSFLLHGFFNYQYLVVGKSSDDRWFIGVPGVYQRQERVMAAIFGFPEFAVIAADQRKEEAGSEPVNQFGCWIRYMEV